MRGVGVGWTVHGAGIPAQGCPSQQFNAAVLQEPRDGPASDSMPCYRSVCVCQCGGLTVHGTSQAGDSLLPCAGKCEETSLPDHLFPVASAFNDMALHLFPRGAPGDEGGGEGAGMGVRPADGTRPLI